MKKIKYYFLLLPLAINAEIKLLDRIAVIVDDGVIMESQIKSQTAEILEQYKNQNINPPSKEILREEIIEKLILDELQLQMATRVGIRISDAELNETFIRIASGNNMELEEFIDYLRSQGTSYENLRENIRRQMLIQRVQQGRVSSEVSITDKEFEGFLQTDDSIKSLEPEIQLGQILVTTKEEANVIDGKDTNWISEPLESGAGFHIIKLMDKRGELVKFEDQWEVRHILMIPSAIRSDEETYDEITSIRERFISGENFDDLAKEFSEDPGTSSNGGDLGWSGKGKYAPEFEATMLLTDIGETSEVFETQFGYHFLQVINKRNKDITNDLIENRAYNMLFSRKYDEALENTLRSMRAEAFVEIKELD